MSPTDTSTTIVPHGQTATGHRHPYAACGCTPNDRAHLANFTHPVKHTFDHKRTHSPKQ
jgi:hypothetical protein